VGRGVNVGEGVSVKESVGKAVAVGGGATVSVEGEAATVVPQAERSMAKSVVVNQ
jgi:hypothetical protein